MARNYTAQFAKSRMRARLVGRSWLDLLSATKFVSPKVALNSPMSILQFPAVAFQARRLIRTQPWLCLALAGSCVLCIGAGAALLRVHVLMDEARRMQAELVVGNRAKAGLPKVVPVEIALRPFDSAEAVSSLAQVAAESGVSLNEVSFTLEEGANLPFLRYRSTMTVSANYLAVRRFVDRAHAQLTDVSLDTLSCARENIAATTLKCELAFTSYYRAPSHG
jgi:hypothetical protein